MQNYRLKIKQPFEALQIGSERQRIRLLSSDGQYLDMDRVIFELLFEPCPGEPKKEPAWKRAQRLQSEAINAAQEAVNESVDAAKKMKELFDGFLGRSE